MAGQQKSTLDIVPISGKKLRFNAQAQFDCSSNTFIVDNVGLLNLRSTAGTILKETGGTTQIDVDNGQLILKSSQNANASNSILVDAAGTTGGITLNSGTGGITESSTGKILIQSTDVSDAAKFASIELSGANLGLTGYDDDDSNVGDIRMKSSNDILADCNDFTLVASDAIKFISTTGDIGFGSNAAASILKFESKTSGSITNTNLIVNQATSSNDRVLDVLVSNESTLEPGYNGILINTNNPNVAADLSFKSSDGLNHFSLGVFPEAFNFSYHQEYLVKTVGTSKIIYPVNDLDFVESDIGRRVYFTQQTSNQTDTIASLGTTILAVDSTNARSDITTSGIYTGTTSAIYRIAIDYQKPGANTFTFKWSNDAGKTYQGTHKEVVGSAIVLEKGISIIFTSSTGHQVGDYWTFHAKRTAVLTTTDRNITTSEIMYTLLDNVGYIRSPLINDFNFSTAGHKRLEITAEGVVGINSEKPTSTLEITNNHNKTLQVNEAESNYQLFPSVASLKSGGYVIVWTSASNSNINNYNIYYQKYSSDGQKIGTSQTSTVNIAQVSHQTWPHVAGQNTVNSNKFAIVWMSKVTDNVSIYLQIYNNTTKVLPNDDILVNTNIDIPSNTKYQSQLYPKVVGLSNGKFLITYPEYDAGTTKLKISGRIFSETGSSVASFQVNNSSGFDSVIYPYPFALSSNDPNYPGGFGVAFMKEYRTSNGSAINYKIKIDGTGTSPESPDTFKWNNDGSDTYINTNTGISITGAAQLLENTVFVDFTNTTGHSIGDIYQFTVQNSVITNQSFIVPARNYKLVIESSGTTFKWNNDGSNTYPNTATPISIDSQLLEGNVLVRFASTSGHSENDTFTFTVENNVISNESSNIIDGTMTPTTSVIMTPTTSNDSTIQDKERFKIQFRVFSLSGDIPIAVTSKDTNIVDSNGNVVTTDLDSQFTPISSVLTISEGLVSAQGCVDGGFIISFYRNHEGTINSSINSSTYNSQSITGAISAATATISSVSGNILNLTNINGRFLIDELITIAGNYTERIKSIDYNTDLTYSTTLTAEVTLSDDYQSIQMYKYNTDGIGTFDFRSMTNATPSAAFQQTSVHTSNLVADSELLNYHTREIGDPGQDTTTFKRPLASIAELPNKDIVVVWCNGDISSIYYQILSGIDGSKIGTEKQISKKYSSLKQRGAMVAATTSAQHLDSGFVVVWQNEVLDTSSNATSNLPAIGNLELETDKHNTGIYQSIIQPNNNLIKIFNEDSNFSISQEGKLGIGTSSPSELLHLKNSDTIDTSNLLFQHNHSNIKTNNLIGNIKYQNNSGEELSVLKGGYSNSYQSLNPDSDNLIAYFKLDDPLRSQTAEDSTITGVVANLENFDIDSCWVDGIINGGLRFDGMNTYVEMDNEKIHDLAQSSFNTNGFSISCWVKIDTNILTGSTYNVLGNLSEALTGTTKVVATGTANIGNGVLLNVQPLKGHLYAGDVITFSNATFTLIQDARFGVTTIIGNVADANIESGQNGQNGQNGTTVAKPGSYSISLVDSTSDGESNAMKPNFKLISSDNTTYTATGITTINDNNWHHIVAVYNNTTNINKIYIYVDGTLEGTTSVSGSIISTSQIKTYLGSIHGETGDDTIFKGDMSEIRFYKSALTNSQITKLNNRGSKNLGKLTFTAQSGLNNTTTSHMANGFTVDETGALQGASLKNHGIYKLDGTVSLTANTNVMTGTGTLLNSNLSTGDTITVDGNDYIVDQVSSETSMTITTTPTSDITSKKVIRKAAITSFLDQDNNIKGVMNNSGALSLGGFNATSKLELRGTSTSGDYPYIHLCNNSETYTDNASESRVVFQGIKRFSDVTQTLDGTFFELSGTRIANSLNYNVFSNNVSQKNYKIRVSSNGNPDQIQVSTDNGATYGNPINIVSPQNKTITISSYDSATGIITKTEGNSAGKPDFESNDVGKYLILPDGTTTIITANTSTNQITVATSLSLSTGNVIRIKVNSLKIHSTEGYASGTGIIKKSGDTKPDFTSSDVGKNVVLLNGISKPILSFIDKDKITIETGLPSSTITNDSTILIEEQQNIGDNLNFQLDHNTGFSINDNWSFTLPTSISSVTKELTNDAHTISLSGNAVNYTIIIDNAGVTEPINTPSTFKVSKDDGATFISTNNTITGNAQLIEDVVFVNFTNTTGHSFDDTYQFTVQNGIISNLSANIQNGSIMVPSCNENQVIYKLIIDGLGDVSNPDTFKVSKDNGATFISTNNSITGSSQLIENNVYVTFNSVKGHTLDDNYEITMFNSANSINATITNPNHNITIGGVDNNTTIKNYKIKIDGVSNPNTFKWNSDGTETYINANSNISISGFNQSLENGLEIKFDAITGHTIGDTWTFVSTPTNATISNASPISETIANMLSLTGTYNENSNKRYQVKIDSIGTNFGDACTFKWSNDAGSSYAATEVVITGGEQTLENDVKIQFPTTTGFTLNDVWDFTGLSISNSTMQDFSYIEGAHQSTSMDSKGKMRFHVNNGTAPIETLSIHNNGRIGVGNNVTPLGNLQVNGDSNNNSNLVLLSKSSSTKVFGEDSNIYFTGTDGLSDGSNALETGSYGKIMGSSNETDANISGRLDFFTNNDGNNDGLTHRMSILHNGNIGVDLPMPQNLFSVSPKTNYTGTATKSLGNITLGTPFSNDAILEGFVVFNNNAKNASTINTIIDTTNLKVDDTNTSIATATDMDIYLPGLNVDTNGYVGIGSSKMNSKIQVGGAIATPIKEIVFSKSPYNISIEDSTILVNSTEGSITVTLPNLTNLVTSNKIKGRIYVIKRIVSSDYNLTINTFGSETIDGSTSYTSLTLNKSITVQTDGDNWFIISKYDA